MLKKRSNIKQKIIDVSTDLFASRGFGGTSIREIARAAGTKIPNIYYYFGSKEGLYNYVLKDAIAHFEASVTEAARGESVRDRLVAMGRAKHRFMAQNTNMMRILFSAWLGSQSGFKLTEEIRPTLARSLVIISEMVKQGMASGELRQVDPKLAAWFLLGVFNTYDMRMVSMGYIPTEEETESVVDLALEGIKRR